MHADDPTAAGFHCWEVRVRGLVQGVGYRFGTLRQAQQLGVTGWVRNEADGSVRALLQQRDPAVLSAMVEWLHRGPLGARVDDVAVAPVEASTVYLDFAISR